MNLKVITLITFVTVLFGCATQPAFDTSLVNKTITPTLASTDFSNVNGAQILWGGVIIAANNLQDATQIEILGYPLHNDQSPNTNKGPIGRFLAINPGYVETIDYAQGRLITVAGQLSELKEGHIGEAIYNYPVVKVTKIHLWPKSNVVTPEPQFRFGIGVILR